MAMQIRAVLRLTLVSALSKGMQQAGGLLITVEPKISAALANPQADWSTIQERVAQHITSVEMSAETSDEAHMTNQEQRVDNTAGLVKMSAKASGKSVMEGNKQLVTGASQTSASSCRPGEHMTISGIDHPQQLREVLAATIARLHVRELQQAQYGIDAPPHIVTELARLRAMAAPPEPLLCCCCHIAYTRRSIIQSSSDGV